MSTEEKRRNIRNGRRTRNRHRRSVGGGGGTVETGAGG